MEIAVKTCVARFGSRCFLGARIQNSKRAASSDQLHHHAEAKRVKKPLAVVDMRALEMQLIKQGHSRVIGVDEAGRGPLAGPVVAAACYIPPWVEIDGIGDSKRLTEAARDKAFAVLMGHKEVQHAVAVIHAPEVDRINILQASLKAMAQSVHSLRTQTPVEYGMQSDYVLIDGNRLPSSHGIPEVKQIWTAAALDDVELQAEALVKGDTKCFCIAAASIIAKVVRDRLMYDLDVLYPSYDLARHKGYPTKRHKELLARHGPSPIHRMSFAPVKAAGKLFAKPKIIASKYFN